jgi:hypothetical protein
MIKADDYLKENADIHYDEDLPCVEYDEVIGLMQDYAKQEAIEFLKWDEENFGWTGIKETKEQKYNRFKDDV